MPHLGYNQPTAWPDLGEIRHEFYRLANRKTMTSAQWHFAGPSRPVEELYDCRKDPQNLKNLAHSTEHSKILTRLRKEQAKHAGKTHDLGYLPEYEAWQAFEGSSGWDVGKSGKIDLKPVRKAASENFVPEGAHAPLRTSQGFGEPHQGRIPIDQGYQSRLQGGCFRSDSFCDHSCRRSFPQLVSTPNWSDGRRCAAPSTQSLKDCRTIRYL